MPNHSMNIFARSAILSLLFAVPAVAQDWNPKITAQYLDSRQKEWFEWPTAKTPDGPCVSCHTGLTYLLARPALRRSLGENAPTSFETGLLDGMRSRVRRKEAEELAKKPTQALGVEAILSALFLSQQDTHKPTLSPDTSRAFDQLWAMQIRDGSNRGAWPWFSLELDPWEMPESAFYGASLAAMAVANTPAEYRNRPDVRERVTALREYLKREQASQPLHNRVAVLWASSTFPDVLSESERKAIISEVLKQQQPDGGWTIESLGKWAPHPNAPASSGSNGYATAFVAYVLQQSAGLRSNKQVGRALDWLKSHQDRQSGTWAATSMNKVFEPDSMQIRFMQDAATAFATLALLESR